VIRLFPKNLSEEYSQTLNTLSLRLFRLYVKDDIFRTPAIYKICFGLYLLFFRLLFNKQQALINKKALTENQRFLD